MQISEWSATHTSKRPESIWKEAKQSSYPVPRLRISSVAMHFAAAIGQSFVVLMTLILMLKVTAMGCWIRHHQMNLMEKII